MTLATFRRFGRDPVRPVALLRPALLLGVLCLATVAGGGVAAQEDEAPPPTRQRHGDLVSIFSGDIEVPANVDRRGLVFSLGGDVDIEGSAREVVVIFGSLRITGEVHDQVVGVFSHIELDGAEIGGQFVNVLGTLDETDSVIYGERVEVSPFGTWFPGVSALLFWFRMFFLFCGFIMLLLLALVVPDRIRAMGEAAPLRYVPAFFVGILGYLGMLVLFSLLSLTVIGIPLAIAAVFVLRWLGIAGLFYAIGRRLGRGVGAEMSVIGAVLLSFTLYALLKLAPTPLGVVGLVISGLLWTLFFLLIDVPAIGLLILTRLGTRTADPGLAGFAPQVPIGTPPAVPPRADMGDSLPPPAT